MEKRNVGPMKKKVNKSLENEAKEANEKTRE